MSDLSFHIRVARLLAELQGDEYLSEQQCAKVLGVDLVSWRVIAHTFSRGAGWVEGARADMRGPTTEQAISTALKDAGRLTPHP